MININLIGATSITLAKSQKNSNGDIMTTGVTFGLNTGFLFAVAAFAYILLTTGSLMPVEGLTLGWVY